MLELRIAPSVVGIYIWSSYRRRADDPLFDGQAAGPQGLAPRLASSVLSAFRAAFFLTTLCGSISSCPLHVQLGGT